jgi:hypothetical protein
MIHGVAQSNFSKSYVFSVQIFDMVDNYVIKTLSLRPPLLRDRQCTYNVTVRRVRATIVVVEK